VQPVKQMTAARIRQSPENGIILHHRNM
jgi:hypothetical protein